MSDTLQLILQLVDIAPVLERALGDEWPRFRDDLLALSGRLERYGDSAALDQEFDAFLARLLRATPEEDKGAVRRAKLYFLRGRSGKSARIREKLQRSERTEAQ